MEDQVKTISLLEPVEGIPELLSNFSRHLRDSLVMNRHHRIGGIYSGNFNIIFPLFNYKHIAWEHHSYLVFGLKGPIGIGRVAFLNVMGNFTSAFFCSRLLPIIMLNKTGHNTQ
jgi:hypothetical protein